MMDGKIWFESEPGKGSAFTFIVHMKSGEVKSQNVFAMQRTNFKGSNILLAEDIAINREIVLTALEPAQLNVDCAANGAEAVRMFVEAPEKHEMILMDFQMPIVNGY